MLLIELCCQFVEAAALAAWKAETFEAMRERLQASAEMLFCGLPRDLRCAPVVLEKPAGHPVVLLDALDR